MQHTTRLGELDEVAAVPAGELHAVQARYDDRFRRGTPRDRCAHSLNAYWPIAGLGLVLAIAVIVAWRFKRRIAAPLADVLKSVERLSSGDWTTHVEVPNGRVGRALGTALERLRINLSDHAATGRALDIMLDSMNDAVFVTSPEGLIKRVNLAAIADARLVADGAARTRTRAT